MFKGKTCFYYLNSETEIKHLCHNDEVLVSQHVPPQLPLTILICVCISVFLVSSLLLFCVECVHWEQNNTCRYNNSELQSSLIHLCHTSPAWKSNLHTLSTAACPAAKYLHLCFIKIKLSRGGEAAVILQLLSCAVTQLFATYSSEPRSPATFSSTANLLCLIVCFPITSLSLLAENCQLWLCEPFLRSVTGGNVRWLEHFPTHLSMKGGGIIIPQGWLSSSGIYLGFYGREEPCTKTLPYLHFMKDLKTYIQNQREIN